MPNWCRNVIKCEDDVIQDIKNKYIYSIKDSNGLDFQKICPMPKELENLDAGPDMQLVPIYLAFLHQTDKDKYTRIFDDIKSHMSEFHQKLYFSNMQKLIKKNLDPEKVEKGKEYVELFLKYGAFTWFDWCVDHWGTKWNSSEGNMHEEDSISFTTAWNPPYRVLRMLSEKYPNQTFYCYFAEEGETNGYYEINAGWISNGRELTEEEINDVLASY